MSKTKKTQPTVWHYTYNHIVDILESGVLLPPIMCHHYETHNFVPAHMRYSKEVVADAKLLLFSQREDWEPASYRAVRVGGEAFPLRKLDDYARFGWKVFRIGVQRNLLHPWLKLKRLASMPPEMGRALERVARDLGSNPYDWWGTMRPIPQDKWRSVEVYNPATKSWEPLTRLPRVEQQSAPQPGPKLAVDDQGDVEVGREIVSRPSPAASSSWGYL